MIATYHNHTTWSDGKANVAELVAAAVDMGIDELGISDHLVVHADGRSPSWAMPPDAFPTYVDEILSVARATDDMRVRLGVEVDWFPEHAREIRAAIDGCPLDFVIGSVHEVDGFPIDGSPAPWQALDPLKRDEVHRRYWEHVRSLAESGFADIIAHIDLAKKFGFHPTREPTAQIEAALDAIAATDAVIELNTAGWHKACRDAYPSESILEAARERQIPVTISADGHRPDHLLRDFARAADRLRAAGYAEVARFRKRAITFEPLDDAIAGLVAGHEDPGQDDF